MRIAFDITLMRPGCVLLQAAMGADPEAAKRFPADTWLIAPTPDLVVRNITDSQLDQLVGMVEKLHRRDLV